MGNALRKLARVVGEESWTHMPWKTYRPLGEQYKVMPTFAVIEWTYRLASWACLAHAAKVGNLPTWFSAWVCGTANDIWFMWLPLSDAFHQAQATVMLTPRLPLYIVEMYSVIIYIASTAARQFNLPYLAEGCLTGLLAHVLYGVYDINGPPYLWWTWHDGDPAISKRMHNAPIGSTMWILTYIGLHQMLLRFTEYPACDANITVLMDKLVKFAPERLKPLAAKAIQLLAKLQLGLNGMPWAVRIAWSGIVCTPLFMQLMGVFQAFSLDKVGIPGKHGFRRAHNSGALRLPKLGETAKANKYLLGVTAAFYTVNLYLGCTGDSTKHVSTGCHQPFRKTSKTCYDIMRYPREEYLLEGAPRENSRNDFRLPTDKEDGALDASGAPIIKPRDDGSNKGDWFTVMGLPRQDKDGDNKLMLLFSALGLLGYSAAFTDVFNFRLPSYIKG